MAQVPSNPEIEQLAAAIGEEVYIEIGASKERGCCCRLRLRSSS